MMKRLISLCLIGLPLAAAAQVPVDDQGRVIGETDEQYADYEDNSWSTATGNEDIPLLSETELEELIGPIALYPDDLLAVVLPASTYPLQVVEAGRFLEALERDSSLTPDEDWDDSIIALINYPEVVELLNEDLDWTWRLGEAVVAQQADVVNAVERFRNQAYAAGNLQSDQYQTVHEDDGIIEITPVSDEVIYVPYYEPAEVVVYQPRRVYYYYPDPCPVYYYPYPSRYDFRRGFNRGYFWGVTTAFTIGWHYDHLRVFHHSYRGHPYYGRRYWDRWWYRRPSIHVYNRIYVNQQRTYNRYTHGDSWRPSRSNRLRYSDQRIVPRNQRRDSGVSVRNSRRDGNSAGDRRWSTLNRDGYVDSDRRRAQRGGESRNNYRDSRADTARSERRQRPPATDNSRRRGTVTPPANSADRYARNEPRAQERQRGTTTRRGGTVEPADSARRYTRNEPRAQIRQRGNTSRRGSVVQPTDSNRHNSQRDSRAQPSDRRAAGNTAERRPPRAAPERRERATRGDSDGESRRSANRSRSGDEARRRRR